MKRKLNCHELVGIITLSENKKLITAGEQYISAPYHFYYTDILFVVNREGKKSV